MRWIARERKELIKVIHIPAPAYDYENVLKLSAFDSMLSLEGRVPI